MSPLDSNSCTWRFGSASSWTDNRITGRNGGASFDLRLISESISRLGGSSSGISSKKISLYHSTSGENSVVTFLPDADF